MILRPLALLSALAILCSGLLATSALAAQTQVAVAANFTQPAKEIAAAFARTTGHHAVLSFGSSGGIYTQIAHGAPYEVFLSADAERTKMAEQAGLAVPGTRITYAVGQLVLYSKTPGLVDAHGEVLRTGRFASLAIADPASAPYGAAAIETLHRLRLYDALEPKIVKGESIAQTYQFAATGAADVGFVALSQVVDERGGSRWVVPETLHAPIDQEAVLVKTGRNNPAAKAFLAFLQGPQAKAIIRRFGYEVR
jgi:molybdate transport system substrate-binding protein